MGDDEEASGKSIWELGSICDQCSMIWMMTKRSDEGKIRTESDDDRRQRRAKKQKANSHAYRSAGGGIEVVSACDAAASFFHPLFSFSP